jgi:hypothetical protein
MVLRRSKDEMYTANNTTILLLYCNFAPTGQDAMAVFPESIHPSRQARATLASLLVYVYVMHDGVLTNDSDNVTLRTWVFSIILLTLPLNVANMVNDNVITPEISE